MKRSRNMPNYCEEAYSDVEWTMQEVVSEAVDSTTVNGYQDQCHEVNQPEDPLGYRNMSEGKEKRKKKKKHHKDKSEKLHKRIKLNRSDRLEDERVGVNKDVGYGLGLSRGFSLWRTLKDIRHFVTKVSDPMTKAQRRALRRKLTYYVDDLEKIVVGVNPRAPVALSEDNVSGDEEMREEVNALIDDALDEAALQGKIVQSDYFETRMSYLEQKCATLKKQLEEVASKKFVLEETPSVAVQEQDKQEVDEPEKRKNEEDEEDCEKDNGTGQLQEKHDPELVLRSSPTLLSPLCSSQAPEVTQLTNDATQESHREGDEDNDAKRRLSVGQEIDCAKDNTQNEEHVNTELTQPLGQMEEPSKEKNELIGSQENSEIGPSQKVQEEVSEKPESEPFRGWGSKLGRPRGRGRGRGRNKTIPAILRRINLNY